MTCRFGLLGLCSIVVFVGCGGGQDGPEQYSVTGTVTLDGKPLPEGMIAFEADPPDGKAPDHATITNGGYSAEVSEGKKKVQITHKVTEMVPMGDTKMEMENETIPAQYNVRSKLSADVKADTENTFYFELKSK